MEENLLREAKVVIGSIPQGGEKCCYKKMKILFQCPARVNRHRGETRMQVTENSILITAYMLEEPY